MSGAIAIEAACDGDGDAIAALIAAVFADYPDCPFDRAAEFRELDAVASHFAELGGRIWVARPCGPKTGTETGVTGCLGIHPTSEPGVWEIKKVYVSKDARGGGIAGRMHAEALAFAAERGAAEVRLWTDIRFTEGHRFYEAKGYDRVAVVRALADLGRTWEYAYRRRLP